MMKIIINKRCVRVLLCIFIIVLCSFASCIKDPFEPPPPPHYTISPKILEWSRYKEGDYWVFRNDSTGELDTLTIIRTSIDKSKHTDPDGHTDLTYDFLETSYSSENNVTHGEMISYTNILYRYYEYLSGYPISILYYDNTLDAIGGDNLVYYTEIILNDSIYKEVYRTQVTYLKKNIVYENYIARHIGVIKYSITGGDNSGSWTIIDYGNE